MHAVVLRALHQVHVLKTRGDGFDGVDQVLQHRDIVRNAFHAGLAVFGARRVEDVRHGALIGERAAAGIALEQVRRDPPKPVCVPARGSREADTDHCGSASSTSISRLEAAPPAPAMRAVFICPTIPRHRGRGQAVTMRAWPAARRS